MKKPYKILIVDDEPYNNSILKLKFENAGYDVVTAANGLEGLKKFKVECPDVVITDIKMPLMDGKELCRSLREESKAPSLIIVITSIADKSERLWISEMDNLSLVEKPISPRCLVKIVEDFFSKSLSQV